MANDLRAWLSKVEAQGELAHVNGADWNLEIGTISTLHSRSEKCTALLFDNITGYPKGHRVLTCSVTNLRRLGLTLNIPEYDSGLGYVRAMREKLAAWEGKMHEFPYQAGFHRQMKLFSDCVLKDLPSPLDVWEASVATILTEKAIQAARTGTAVPVNLADEMLPRPGARR